MDLQVDGDRGAAGEGLQGRAQPAVGQHRGVDAAGDLAQFLGRGGGLGDGAVQARIEVAELGRHGRLRGAQLQGQGDQPLLGAVVQVAFDAPPGLVTGRHDAGPGGGQLGVQLGVVQGDGQLPGDELDRVQPVGGERAADQPVLRHQHRA